MMTEINIHTCISDRTTLVANLYRWLLTKNPIITCLLVNSLKNISIDIEHIKDCLENTNELHQTIGVLKDTVVHLVRQNNWLCESVKAMKKDLRTLKDNQTPSQTVGKQKNSNVKKKVSGNKSTYDSTMSHSIHMEEALQENIVKFVEELSFGNTLIPDRLIETECLSDDECATLQSKQGKDQVRCLFYKLMGRGPEKITTFLQILDEHGYEYLTKYVNESADRINRECKGSKIECLVCYIKKTVDLRDISDYLISKKMIKREIYGAILESSTLHANRDFLWSNILDGANMTESIDVAKHLIEALKGKYDYLTKHISDNQCLQCLCHVRRRRRRHRQYISETGSQSDFSTTSDWSKVSQIEQNLVQSEVDSRSLSSSTDHEMPSFANLDLYLSKRQVAPCDSTTQDLAEHSVYFDCISRNPSEEFDLGDETDLASYCKCQQSVPYVEVIDDKRRPNLEQSISVSSTVTICPRTPTTERDIFQDLNEESTTDLDHSDIPQSSTNMDPDVNSGQEILNSQDSLD